MALTPEDVRNKQFSTAKRKGYEMDEVDSFLDQVELEIGTLARENAELKGRVTAAEQAAAAAQAAPPAPAAPDHNAEAVAMLALAQKTAEEHKSKAKAEAEALLADAKAKAAALEQSAATERANLERRVEELRAFEREYRTRLRQHHEAALKDLDHRGTDTPAAAPAAGGVPTAPPQQAVPGAPAAPAAAAPPAAPSAPAAPAQDPVPPLAPPAVPAAPTLAPPGAAPSAPQGSPFAVPQGDETPPHQG